MARHIREDYDGAWHHVMNRGARRVDTFLDAGGRKLFLNLVERSVAKHGIEVHAYSLMPNHYHLLVRSPRGSLSAAMQLLGGRYTAAVNSHRGWDGALFRGRFRSKLITSDAYLLTVAAYIHLNPVRAGLVLSAEEQSWTSHRAYVGLEAGPSWLRTKVVSKLAGGVAKFRQLVADLASGRGDWPHGFDPDSWMSDEPEEAFEMRDAGSVLARVAGFTGRNSTDLGATSSGRGASQERRLAIWALARHTALTHREIAQLLGTTKGAISAALLRVKRDPVQPLKKWMEQWDETFFP